MRRFAVTAAFITIAASYACGFETKKGAGLDGGSHPGTFDAALDRTYTNSEVNTTVTGDACGSNMYTANHLPPDLLILLDRSNSMNEDASGTQNPGPMSKWSLMTAAIKQVVAQTETTIRWGLKFFGTDGQCGVTAGAAVAPGPNNSAMIATAIDGTTAASYTPTSAGEMSAGTYLDGLNDPNPKYILLATDGQPTCGPPGNNSSSVPDDMRAITTVGTVAGMGIPTFVIGIATTKSATADSTLNQMAVMGGHPRAGTPQYYPVSTTAELATALTTIQAMVNLPCKYTLPGMVSNPSMVTVIIGGTAIPSSSWTLDAGNRSITIIGPTCDMLTAGTLKDVQINTGCQILIP